MTVEITASISSVASLKNSPAIPSADRLVTPSCACHSTIAESPSRSTEPSVRNGVICIGTIPVNRGSVILTPRSAPGR